MRQPSFLRRHREHDRLDPPELPLVEVEPLHLLAEPGNELEHALQRPHLPQHPVAREEVVEGELSGADALLHLRLLVLLDRRLRLLDERHDVAHAEDPRGHPVRMEVLELVELLSDGDELHRTPRDSPNGERRASARVAVELREHDAVEGDALLESERDVHRLLTRHRVEHEEHVRRLRRPRNPLELGHELVVDVQSTRGVEDHDVQAVRASRVEPLRRGRDGIGAVEGEHGQLDLPAELLELVDGRRALEVAGDEPWPLRLASEQEPELRGCRRLPRALQAGEEDHGGRAAESEPRVARAHERGELLVDDLHHLLPRREAPQDVLSERALLDRGSEVTRDLEVHVRLEEREPDLAHRLRDGVLVEADRSGRGRRAWPGACPRGCRTRPGSVRLDVCMLDAMRRRRPQGGSYTRSVDESATSRRDLPTGTVTLVFADVEGSTRLLHLLGERFAPARARMRDVVRAADARHGGAEVDWAGDGVFLAFSSARSALAAVVEIQRALADEPSPSDEALRLRMGIHTGEPTLGDEGYVGMDVVVAARICAAAHGDQVVVSRATRDMAGDEPVPGGSYKPLGKHRLKDVPGGTQLFQLLAPGLHDDFPPLRTLSATSLPTLHHRLVGRADALARIESLLEEPNVRLVTITGPGGAGKSRLALEVAAGCRARPARSPGRARPGDGCRLSSPTRSRARSASGSRPTARSSRPSQTR